MSSSGAFDTSTETIEIASGPSRLRVARAGGELLSATMSVASSESRPTRTEHPVEFIRFGGSAWPHHAPVLFPAICRHPADAITVGGRQHPLEHHGFLRDLDLSVVSHTDTEAVLRAVDTAETRARFPFPFSVEIIYRAESFGFSVDFVVSNPGTESMPYGLGWHPAFRRADDDHPSVRWKDAPGHVRRVNENLLTNTIHPPPHQGTSWPVDSSRFTDGGLICPVPSESSIHCRLGAGRRVEMSWRGFDHLTLWSPPIDDVGLGRSDGRADLLCIEPWRGLPAREDWTGDESERADLVHLGPGENVTHSVRCTLSATAHR